MILAPILTAKSTYSNEEKGGTSLRTREGWIRGAVGFSILLMLCAACLVLLSDGFMGYDIIATVDSNKWEIHRSTQAMYYASNGSMTGAGSFSKYANIDKIGGMKSGEFSYALNGSIDYKERFLLRSLEGPVKVNTKFEDIVIDDHNETEIDLDTGKIQIQEQWPTYIADYSWIRYIGPGIRTRDRFENNGDVIFSSIHAKKLNKENLFKAHINKTVILVNLTSTSVKETRLANKSTTNLLTLQAFDASTKFGLARHKFFAESEPFGRPVADDLILQEYVGNQNMTLKVEMSDYVFMPGEQESWLDCCLDEATAGVGNYMSPVLSPRYSFVDDVFNASFAANSRGLL
jgi:hypothetical protein